MYKLIRHKLFDPSWTKCNQSALRANISVTGNWKATTCKDCLRRKK